MKGILCRLESNLAGGETWGFGWVSEGTAAVPGGDRSAALAEAVDLASAFSVK